MVWQLRKHAAAGQTMQTGQRSVGSNEVFLPVGVPQTDTSLHGWQASPTGNEILLFCFRMDPMLEKNRKNLQIDAFSPAFLSIVPHAKKMIKLGLPFSLPTLHPHLPYGNKVEWSK